MRFIKQYLFSRRKQKKIRITFKADGVIKVVIPKTHPAVAGQIFENIKYQYQKQSAFDSLTGLPVIHYGQ